ncbi:MAG: dipeptidase [Patescibacteria group bacterium]
MDDVLGFLEQNFDHALAGLTAFCRIPSISAVPSHRHDVMRCAIHLHGAMMRYGATKAGIYPDWGHPVVSGEWSAGRPDAPTVLVYGHYDVQPVDHLEAWQSPPFEPEIRDGYLYGRGTVDDKGQVWMHLMAIEAWRRTRGELPITIKMVVEGEEESEGTSLVSFLAAHGKELAPDAIVISDTAMVARGVPTITLGMRGLCYLEVEVESLPADVHSGTFGGAVENPAQVLCRVLASLKNHYGQVTIPGFYDSVRSLSGRERQELDALACYEEQFRLAAGAQQFSRGEWGYSPFTRMWRRPTLDICGLRSGFIEEGVKTIIPARAHAKISMRLVPDQDPKEIMNATEEHLRLLTQGRAVRLSVKRLDSGRPYLADRNRLAIAAAQRALFRAFGRETVFAYEGGSIPALKTFADMFGKPCVLFGFGLPDEQSHGPNERLLLDNFRLGMKSCALLYDELSRMNK